MDEHTEVTGLYVTSMLNSAGAVSPVFEKKMNELLAEYGIHNPDPEEWYDAAAFAEAVDRATDEIGEKTIHQAGVEMGRDVPQPDSVGDPHDALQIVDRAQQDAYRGGEETRPAGSYRYERVGPSAARMSVTESFPYPKEIVTGSLEGIVKSVKEGTGRVTVESVPTEPVDDPELDPESYAVRIEW